MVDDISQWTVSKMGYGDLTKAPKYREKDNYTQNEARELNTVKVISFRCGSVTGRRLSDGV